MDVREIKEHLQRGRTVTYRNIQLTPTIENISLLNQFEDDKSIFDIANILGD